MLQRPDEGGSSALKSVQMQKISQRLVGGSRYWLADPDQISTHLSDPDNRLGVEFLQSCQQGKPIGTEGGGTGIAAHKPMDPDGPQATALLLMDGHPWGLISIQLPQRPKASGPLDGVADSAGDIDLPKLQHAPVGF
jgi:hypothetical protein